MTNPSSLYYGNKTPSSDSLAEAMDRIDTTPSWQVIIGHYYRDTQKFELSIISRGPIPTLPPDAFQDIKDMIEIEEIVPEQTGRLRDYGVTFNGDQDGMNIFVDVICNRVQDGAEGARDIIKECGGPVVLVSTLLGGAATKS